MNDSSNSPLALWGGLECTVNRVGDDYFSQLERNGHAERACDIGRFAGLGIRAIRYPVLWERTAPDGLDRADWTWPDERLAALRAAGITPIAGLVHHGSGPRHTSLVDPGFAEELAAYAGAVAARYPWLDYYTPVNEPCTTARFAGLYGVWYPHGRDDRSFIRALLNQCRATVLAMRAIRAVNPNAKLVQTDDLGKTYSTPALAHVAEFYNERRWLAWDLLCGKVDPQHALWDYLLGTGIDAEEFLWFRANPCPPDIIGVNYYVTSERWLDHRPQRYPEHHRGVADGIPCADIEASRVLATPTAGIAPLLGEAWERYRIPLAITEAHIDAHREDQLRWLLEIWEAAQQARSNGADVRAVTVWSLLGSFDWNCLVTANRGYYEPGPFDLRAPLPRPTALAHMMVELASGSPLSHPVLRGQGWWRRPGRFLCAQPVATPEALASIAADGHRLVGSAASAAPILVLGANGTLAQAFARICGERSLVHQVLSDEDIDLGDAGSVERMLAAYQPWAVIDAGEGNGGAAVLADACAHRGVHLTTFQRNLESAGPGEHPGALVVSMQASAGPWDGHAVGGNALEALMRGAPVTIAGDGPLPPTYVSGLVHACLDLAVDREVGIWHLANADAVTWDALVGRAATDGYNRRSLPQS